MSIDEQTISAVCASVRRCTPAGKVQAPICPAKKLTASTGAVTDCNSFSSTLHPGCWHWTMKNAAPWYSIGECTTHAKYGSSTSNSVRTQWGESKLRPVEIPVTGDVQNLTRVWPSKFHRNPSTAFRINLFVDTDTQTDSRIVFSVVGNKNDITVKRIKLGKRVELFADWSTWLCKPSPVASCGYRRCCCCCCWGNETEWEADLMYWPTTWCFAESICSCSPSRDC